jgi:hypothetical protein
MPNKPTDAAVNIYIGCVKLCFGFFLLILAYLVKPNKFDYYHSFHQLGYHRTFLRGLYFMGCIVCVFVGWFFWKDDNFRLYYIQILCESIGIFYLAALITDIHNGQINLASLNHLSKISLVVFGLAGFVVVGAELFKMAKRDLC